MECAMRLVPLLLLLLLSGCHWSYTIPNDAADFGSLGLLPPETPEEIESASRRPPAANLPATLAVIRLQGRGGPVVVNVRTVEDQADIGRLAKMPHICAVVPLNDIVCGQTAPSLDAVRESAARVRADLVLVYTFETVSNCGTTIPLLGTLTLGIFPNELARAISTCSAALVDTRTGHIYGLSEATTKSYRITNAWNTWTARQAAEESAQDTACKNLIGRVEVLWAHVLKRHAPGVPSS
jgi:hypothetical protein